MTSISGFDGRIRLTRQQILALGLTHLDSGVDSHVIDGTVPAACVAGVTEWCATVCEATVSVGWDWYLAAPGVIAVYRPELIRSNLMLVSERGIDQGARATAINLLDLINGISWQAPVLACLEGPVDCSAQAGP